MLYFFFNGFGSVSNDDDLVYNDAYLDTEVINVEKSPEKPDTSQTKSSIPLERLDGKLI